MMGVRGLGSEITEVVERGIALLKVKVIRTLQTTTSYVR